MCLVNELARYNKIQPEYKLLSEQGPAHSKVHLTLYLSVPTFLLAPVIFIMLFLSFCLDIYCAVDSGGAALGGRGHQYKESSAFCSSLCAFPDHTAQTQ